jgi:hypothetical protein
LKYRAGPARKKNFRKIVVFLQRRESEILHSRKAENKLNLAIKQAALKLLEM